MDASSELVTLETQRHPSPPTAVCSVLTIRLSSIRQKRIAERYRPSVTDANRFWAGTILHWAAYIWHWRRVLDGGDTRTCLCALAAGWYCSSAGNHHEVEVLSAWWSMMTSSNGNLFRVAGPFHRSPVDLPVDSLHKGQWRGALMYSVICAWTNAWANNRDAGDLRWYRAHNDVTLMQSGVSVNPISQLFSCYQDGVTIWDSRPKYT